MVRKKLMQLGLVLLTGMMTVGTASAQSGGSGGSSFLNEFVNQALGWAVANLPSGFLQQVLSLLGPLLGL